MDKSLYKTLINFDFSQRAALCSLIFWKGSVPRKDYPLMLVTEKKETTGTIGGGNLEYQAIEIAGSVIKSGQSILETFDLTNSEATSPGSLCGGITKILFEPFTSINQNFWISVDYLQKQDDNIIITEVDQKGTIVVFRHLINQKSSLQEFPLKVKQTVHSVRQERNALTVEIDNKYYLIQPIIQPSVLHIFGAGHIGKAVAELAHFIDLDVCVYDDREELANSISFPYAKSINHNVYSKLSNQNIDISPNDYILIATRGHLHDLDLLRWLLTLNVSYIGLVCSKRKWKLLSAELINEGFTMARIKTVQAPVGLDIKSETVPEIAVSIISEVILHSRNGQRSNLSLSFNPGNQVENQ